MYVNFSNGLKPVVSISVVPMGLFVGFNNQSPIGTTDLLTTGFNPLRNYLGVNFVLIPHYSQVLN